MTARAIRRALFEIAEQDAPIKLADVIDLATSDGLLTERLAALLRIVADPDSLTNHALRIEAADLARRLGRG